MAMPSNKASIRNNLMLAGAFTGAIIGWFTAFIDLVDTGTFMAALIGAALGAIIGAILTASRKVEHTEIGQTLHLHEEKLDVTKHHKQTGEVHVHKEIVQEQQTITVPITKEEVVIEKTVMADAMDPLSSNKEIIRIPISEERIEVSKHPVKVAEVSVSKRSVEQSEEVTETLKKEKARVQITGIADVHDEASASEEHRL
jgi:uncharacterized protein (TIGR02271 family)